MKFLNQIDGADKLITDASNRLVSDTKIAEWDAKPNTNTTYSEITTSEIDVGTASTLRTITARRIKYIMDKIISLITKSDIGLGNVDNTSDATKQVLSAIKLSTLVNINEVPFDGSTNIIIKDNTKEPSFIKNGGFNKSFGTTAGTVVEGNDSRLSNARVPTAHSHAIGDLPTYPTLASLGASPSSHSHTMANITDIGNISSIDKNASTANFLRGDGTWVTPPNTNTTYSAMSVAEGTTGTATSSRTVRADYLKQIIQGHIPSSLPANGGNADTVGGFTVGMNVPAGSKLTDTVYTHPTTAGNKHIPTGGTVGQILKNTASGTATWQNENAAGVTSVTAGNGLNFTSISSTGAVTLGTPGTVTNATTNSVTSTSHTHALTVTKADVGLSLVDNAKQMPIAGGTFTGIAKALPNTSYTVSQVRNVILSTASASLASMQDGEIWIKYK